MRNTKRLLTKFRPWFSPGTEFFNLENFESRDYNKDMKVCINGKFVSAANAKVSVFDSGFTSGYGIYETLQALDGEVHDLEEHIDRLFRSAKMVGLKLPWTKTQISNWTKKIVGKGLLRVRITVSFEPTLVIFAIPLEKSKKGFKATTHKIERILPEAKTTCLLPQYLARRQMKGDEVLLINHKNEITEGSVTNVFFVRSGKLITPKSDILKGTMRTNVIKAARKLKIPVKERSVKKSELKNFQECFITNSLMIVMPILSIDGRRISAKIGPLTQKIQAHVYKKN